MKKLPILLAVVLSLFVACDQPRHHARHKTHKKTVHVHKADDGKRFYHEIDTDSWFELELEDGSPYIGEISNYQASHAGWRAVNVNIVPANTRAQVIEEEANPQTEQAEHAENADVDASEHMDAAAVETVEIDVTDAGTPVDPSVDLASDGTYDSSGYDSNDSSSSDSSSSDSSSSSDYSSSDSSSSDSSSSSPD